MRIMTCNIWGDYFNNPVEMREDAFRYIIDKYQPDILGIQEFTQSWYNSNLFLELQKLYTVTTPNNYENFTPLFFRTDKFHLINSNWELYEDTPDPSKGISWAVLVEPQNNEKKIAVLNTHFWWKSGDEHDLIRQKNALRLSALMKQLSDEYHTCAIAFGDFNCNISNNPVKVLKEHGVVPMIELAKEFDTVSSHHGDPQKGSDGLYHGTKTNKNYEFSIDHIMAFQMNRSVSAYKVIEDQIALDASDHSPIYTDFDD